MTSIVLLRTLAITCGVVVALTARSFGQCSSDAETIASIEQGLAKAWLTRDRAAIDAVLAPEWSVTDAAGQVLSKDQVMQETFGSSERRIEAMAIDDLRVRVFGDAAIATGRTRATGSYRGTSATVVLRFTDVFVRRDNRWRVVASHASAVAPA
jgi:ketosteroid isomerase-like protein